VETSAFRLRGEMDVKSLLTAFGDVMARHEILRTRYVEDHDEPVQVVDPPGTAPTRVVDLSSVPGSGREAALRQLLDTVTSQHFDLATGPVLKLTVARLGAAEHAIMLAVHHIATDGWSEGLLYRELWHCYRARLAGQEPTPAGTVRQYREYAARQRGEVANGRLDHQLPARSRSRRAVSPAGHPVARTPAPRRAARAQCPPTPAP
jgi:hypothetical protein